MSTPAPYAAPVSIQLTQFNYDFDYEQKVDCPITFKADIQHRIPTNPDADEIQVLVTITYRAQDQEQPVLQATCLTTYMLMNVAKTEGADGVQRYTMPSALGKQMTIEAIAHARALLAQHTAGTPFQQAHVPLNFDLNRAPAVEDIQQA